VVCRIDYDNGRCNLIVERDSGNLFTVLMGSYPHNLKAWKKLRTVCNQAIKVIESENANKGEDNGQ
jgi:hypothetical protein